MNFIKTLTTANFIVTIISFGAENMISLKPTTDTAKMYCKVKKLSKNDPILVGNLMDYVTTLESGVDALAKI